MSVSKIAIFGILLAAIQIAKAESERGSEIEGEALATEEIRLLRNLSSLEDEEKKKKSLQQVQALIKRAQQFSPALREGRYAIEAASQDINAAKGAKLPQITISGASTTYAGQIASSNRADGRIYAGVNASLALYDFGRIEANVSAKEASRDATSARYKQQSNQLAIEAINTCLEYTKQRALLFAADEYFWAVKELGGKLEQIVVVDVGRKAELVQVRSRILQANQARENAKSYIRDYRARLEKLLGENKSQLCDQIGLFFLVKPDLEKILLAIKDNPQVRAAQLDYETAKKQLEQVAASRKPQVVASVALAPVAPGIANEYYQSISVGVSMPIYDGNILQSGERAAFERTNAAAERVDQTIIQLKTEYKERFEMATASLRRADEYTTLLEVNDQVRKDFFVQWNLLGRRTLFELLAIEQEQYTLQQGYFTALVDGLIGVATIQGLADELPRVD